jgi:hypothetical protein
MRSQCDLATSHCDAMRPQCAATSLSRWRRQQHMSRRRSVFICALCAFFSAPFAPSMLNAALPLAAVPPPPAPPTVPTVPAPSAAPMANKKRTERPYTEVDVRRCLGIILGQHSVGVTVQSAYAVSKDEGWPGMRSVVRASALLDRGC